MGHPESSSSSSPDETESQSQFEMDRHAVDASDTDASGVETSGVDASSVIASDVDASPEHPARRNTDQLAIGITGQAMRCWMQQHQPSVIRDVQSSAWTDWQRLSWNDDLRFRCNRTLMTTLLRDSVPVLAASGWRISAISEGRCKSVMPLSLSNSNQHHTHQAAMIALSADYTGGMALTTVLRGAPIYGVHTTERLGAVSMWLANLDTRYLAPSQGSLHAVCSVDEKKMRMARRRFFAGKRLSVDLNIVLRSGEVEVAHAVAKYFAVVADEDTIPLAGKSESSSAGSAHMIAALRGQSSYQTQDGQVIRVDRPHDLAAAGPAGQRMAARVRQTLPQLPAMIDARTRHVAATIHATVPRQVVMIAAGMDMLPLRFSSQDLCRRIRVFEIDLPEMLQQRRRVFESLKGRRMAFRYPIAADVCKQDFAAMLRQHHRFDPQAVTLFLIEGLSMYLTLQQNINALRQVRSLMESSDSRVWMDIVSTQVGEGTHSDPNIVAFLEAMRSFGEPFIFGCADPRQLLHPAGLNLDADLSVFSDQFIDLDDPVMREYQFVVGGVSPSPRKPR